MTTKLTSQFPQKLSLAQLAGHFQPLDSNVVPSLSCPCIFLPACAQAQSVGWADRMHLCSRIISPCLPRTSSHGGSGWSLGRPPWPCPAPSEGRLLHIRPQARGTRCPRPATRCAVSVLGVEALTPCACAESPGVLLSSCLRCPVVAVL